MAIQKMTYEAWDRNLNRGGSVETPGWSEVQKAITDLDGCKHTLVTLEAAGRTLMVGGGARGDYVVVATQDDQSWTLFSGLRSSSVVQMVVGGQLGDYPAGMVVSLEMANAATALFFEKNALDPSAGWQKD